MDRLAEIYNSDSTKYTNVSKSEKTKRIQKIKEFGERLRRLHADFVRLEGSSGSVDNESGINRERTEDGEYEATKGKTNDQILKQQKDHLDVQDEKLDLLVGVVQATKFEAQNMGGELKTQNKMMDRLNKDMDATEANMVRVEGKMKTLMKESSMCKLMTILIIEFVILLVLLYLNI
jgi:hypothetical protein